VCGERGRSPYRGKKRISRLLPRRNARSEDSTTPYVIRGERISRVSEEEGGDLLLKRPKDFLFLSLSLGEERKSTRRGYPPKGGCLLDLL